LGGQLEPDVVRADLVEAVFGDAEGQFRAIAFTAEVSEVDMAQMARHDGFGGVRGGLIGKVSLSAEDALFKAPGPMRAILEHPDVVVGLEHEDIGVPDPVQDVFGDVAEVGDKSDIAARRAHEESHWILCVVRDVEGLDEDIADFEALAGFEEAAIEAASERAFRFFLGGAIAVDGDVEFAGDPDEALDVVAVFVGDEDGVEVLRGSADGRESLSDLAGAQAGVDENPGFGRLDISAIASGTATQDRELNSHGQP
jgi:hypothetical protein